MSEAKDLICHGCGQPLKFANQYHPHECCISFKAGIKEVVDWASRYEEPYVEFGDEYFPIRIQIPIANWQAQLKDWGIKVE